MNAVLPTKEAFGLALGRLRLEGRNQTQVWVAKQVGLTKAAICKFESGTDYPSFRVAMRLASVLTSGSLDALLLFAHGQITLEEAMRGGRK